MIFNITSPQAFEPTFNNGIYEIRSPEEYINTGKNMLVNPHVTISLPPGYLANVMSCDSRFVFQNFIIFAKSQPQIPILFRAEFDGKTVERGEVIAQVVISEVCNVEPLPVKLLSEEARPMVTAHLGDAGNDLFAAHATTIPAGGQGLVETDIAVAIPFGYYGQIASRSSVANKNRVHVGAGVIDAAYRGPLKVLLYNLSDTDFEVTAGDKIAQLIIIKCRPLPIQIVDSLDETSRGEGGFGSSGK